MNNIKESFDQIHANQELIDSTKAKLREMRIQMEMDENTSPKTKSKIVPFPNRALRLAVACLLTIILIGGGGYSYDVNVRAVSYISIDVNPSMELTLNKKNVVTDAKAFNSQGQDILNQVKVIGKSYEEAVDIIMESKAMSPYLSADSSPTFTIISEDEKTSEEIEQGLQSHHAVQSHHGKTRVASHDIYEKAHDSNLSFGKYNLYEELRTYDSSLTTEQCHDMTVEEMEHEINCHQEGSSSGTEESVSETEEEECSDQETQHHKGHNEE